MTLKNRVVLAPPRLACYTWHLYVDASNDGIKPGIRGILVSENGSFIGHFSDFLEDEVLKILNPRLSENPIFEFECFAKWCGLETWSRLFKGCNVIVFTDNEGALNCMIHGTSKNDVGGRIVLATCVTKPMPILGLRELTLLLIWRTARHERGEPLKRMAACQIPARLQVPVFSAGIHTAPCAFELCSGLFRIGQSTRAGHYRAFGYTTPHRASEIGLAPATAPERAALRTLLRGGSAEGTVIVHDDNQPPQQGSVQGLSDILHNAYILVYIRV